MKAANQNLASRRLKPGVDMQIPHNERSIQPGPLATFPKWKELGRYVKKGEKALTLCMPLTCKRNRTVTKEDGTEREEEFAFTHFTYKAHCYHEIARNVPKRIENSNE
jgi:hypothetical protein